MKLRLWQCNNNPRDFELPDDLKVRGIFVKIITGDEVVTVSFSDGTKVVYDAGRNRPRDYFDGCYEVNREYIDEWLNFRPCDNGSAGRAYERWNKGWS